MPAQISGPVRGLVRSKRQKNTQDKEEAILDLPQIELVRFGTQRAHGGVQYRESIVRRRVSQSC